MEHNQKKLYTAFVRCLFDVTKRIEDFFVELQFCIMNVIFASLIFFLFPGGGCLEEVMYVVAQLRSDGALLGSQLHFLKWSMQANRHL